MLESLQAVPSGVDDAETVVVYSNTCQNSRSAMELAADEFRIGQNSIDPGQFRLFFSQAIGYTPRLDASVKKEMGQFDQLVLCDLT